MENFLLVGSGAREHAIAEAICASGDVRLFAFMSANNPGIMRLAQGSGGEAVVGGIHSPQQVASFAERKKITLAFPSPDAVLAAGVTDALLSISIPCAAPTKGASRLEWDKSYARQLLKDSRVPGSPVFGIFDTVADAHSFIDSLAGEVAIKPSGLTGGKGVKVTGFQLKDASEAKQYASELLAARGEGQPGIVIEEKLDGEEFSLQAFCDGKKAYAMPLVQDHKRAYEGDIGSNTGGMGSYSDANHLLPFISRRHSDEALGIMQKTLDAFHKQEGKRFVGVLYGGFMATGKGVKLIEYNARFGDPEAMNVLPIMKSDLFSTLSQMAAGRVSSAPKFEPKATVCKYLVPEGYPAKSITGQKLSIDQPALSQSGARAYYASVYEKEGAIFTQSSRSIGLVGIAKTIEEAEAIAEKACGAISGKVWHRADIGTKALLARRTAHMEKIGAL